MRDKRARLHPIVSNGTLGLRSSREMRYLLLKIFALSHIALFILCYLVLYHFLLSMFELAIASLFWYFDTCIPSLKFYVHLSRQWYILISTQHWWSCKTPQNIPKSFFPSSLLLFSIAFNLSNKNFCTLLPNAFAYISLPAHSFIYVTMYGHRFKLISGKNCTTYSRYDATATSAKLNPDGSRYFDSDSDSIWLSRLIRLLDDRKPVS